MTKDCGIPPAYHTSDACEDLQSHCGGVYNMPLVDLLNATAAINTALWHNQHPQHVANGVARAKQALAEIEKGLNL